MTALSLLCLFALPQQNAVKGSPLTEANGHLTTTVGGLDRTGASAKIVPTTNPAFAKALQVTIGRVSPETNWTQLTLPVVGKVQRGDVLMATVVARGWRTDGKPARAEVLFERATEPWTKSLTHGLVLSKNWKEYSVPFKAAESYTSGQAMLSLRLAFGPQTVEVGELSVTGAGKGQSLESLVEFAAAKNPIGNVSVAFDTKHPRQMMQGFGGNFCQPRYGSTEAMDVVGRYALQNLPVAHARVGLPLNDWTPEPGVYKDDAQAAASLRALQEMSHRKIPTVVSIWEGPQWMLGGSREQMGRVLDPSKYEACIEAIAEYLVVARDKYKAKVDYVSFNEPDYGVNFKFTSNTMRDFIRQAGPKFAARGLKTKFLVGDTANGTSAISYNTPILSDPTIKQYLGPIAFHCWDVLSAPDEAYTGIANLGKRFNKPVWCLEAGHDAQLWQKPNPWASWENALRTAMAYERTLRLAQPSLIDYWTYQDNYPLVDKNGPKPYPVFGVMKAMESVFAPGSKVLAPKAPTGDLQALATTGPKGRFAALLVNAQGPGRALLSGLRPRASVRILTSDRTKQNVVKAAKTDEAGRLTIKIPTRSVVTLVSTP